MAAGGRSASVEELRSLSIWVGQTGKSHGYSHLIATAGSVELPSTRTISRPPKEKEQTYAARVAAEAGLGCESERYMTKMGTCGAEGITKILKNGGEVMGGRPGEINSWGGEKLVWSVLAARGGAVREGAWGGERLRPKRF